jgi:hypothetical protein
LISLDRALQLVVGGGERLGPAGKLQQLAAGASQLGFGVRAGAEIEGQPRRRVVLIEDGRRPTSSTPRRGLVHAARLRSVAAAAAGLEETQRSRASADQ